jgi:exonuclease V gamma subunit
LQQFERSNPQLAAHGAPSRDLQIWLEDLGYQSIEDAVDTAVEAESPPHRLQVLQRWIDAADEAPGLRERMQASGVLSADAGPLPSIEINTCHGALRQCEALRDDLLRRFVADPTLEPRHVLVMTPDLATYAPLIAAVFGREHRASQDRDAVPAVPVHIADLGLTDTNPVAAVLLDVVGLVGSRVTASKLLELLGREPVRTQFRIDDADLSALKDLIIASGLRWAWDAEDRARHDQPAVDQNTVRFALERLALGVLMPDPGGVEVVPAAHGLGPAVPVDLPGRDQALRFGVQRGAAAACFFGVMAGGEFWRGCGDTRAGAGKQQGAAGCRQLLLSHLLNRCGDLCVSNKRNAGRRNRQAGTPPEG